MLGAWVAAGNDPDDYLSEDDFNLVGEMRDDKGLTKTQVAKQLVQASRQMQEMMARQQKAMDEQAERIRNEERQKWQAKLNEAKDYGNVDDALEAQGKINQMDFETQRQQQPQEPQVDPSVVQFYEGNKDWYGNASGPTDYFNFLAGKNTDQLENAYNNGIPYGQAVEPIMNKVRQKYPEYFEDAQPKRKQKPNLRPRQVTEKSAGKPKVEKKYTLNDLDSSMRGYAKSMIKKMNMDEHEYVKQIVEQ